MGKFGLLILVFVKIMWNYHTINIHELTCAKSSAWKAFSFLISLFCRTLAHTYFMRFLSFLNLCFFIFLRRITISRAAWISLTSTFGSTNGRDTVGRGILWGIHGLGLSVIFMVGKVGKFIEIGNVGEPRGSWFKEQIDRIVGWTCLSAAIVTVKI